MTRRPPATLALALVLSVLAAGSVLLQSARPEAVTLPAAYVGEAPNDRPAYVPFEFYVGGGYLDPSLDFLWQDVKSLTPSLALCKPTSTPSRGIEIVPVAGAVGLVQCKALYSNDSRLAVVFEKTIQVGLVPAGSVTLEVEEITFDLYDVYE